VLLTLLVIGGVAGYAALRNSILRQQDALATSVEGMNFPAENPATVAISSSASSAGLAP
jgi:hypothetical protein